MNYNQESGLFECYSCEQSSHADTAQPGTAVHLDDVLQVCNKSLLSVLQWRAFNRVKAEHKFLSNISLSAEDSAEGTRPARVGVHVDSHTKRDHSVSARLKQTGLGRWKTPTGGLEVGQTPCNQCLHQHENEN